MTLSIPRSLLLCMIGVLFIGCGTETTQSVNSFEECVEQTGVVMESYPRKCNDASGKTWTEEIQDDTPAVEPSTDPEAPVMNPAGDTVIKTSKVVFPKGKESLQTGKSYTIAWESEGVEAFDLVLYEFDRPYKTIAERALASAGKYEWTPTVETLDGKNFRSLTLVMIDSDTQKPHGRSEDTFVIENKE